MTDVVQESLNIAFATSNQTHVDAHFGSCQTVSIYSVTLTSSEHIETIQFTHYAGHHPQKIQDRLTALTNCFAVYCLACGHPVRQQLLAQGTRVVIRPEAELISALLPRIQANWPGKVAFRQARQSHRKKEANYFNELADSEWE